MLPNPQFPTDLVRFTEEILNRKPEFLCSERHCQGPCGVPGYASEQFQCKIKIKLQLNRQNSDKLRTSIRQQWDIMQLTPILFLNYHFRFVVISLFCTVSFSKKFITQNTKATAVRRCAQLRNKYFSGKFLKFAC